MARILTAQELKAKIDAGEKLVLINALAPESFEKKRIPGSINITPEEAETKAPNLVDDKAAPIVVYCASKTCAASPRLSAKLQDLGYTNVSEFRGGLEEWENAGYAFEGSETTT